MYYIKMTKELQGFCEFFSFAKRTNFFDPFRAFCPCLGNDKKLSIFSDKKITKIRPGGRIFGVFSSLYIAYIEAICEKGGAECARQRGRGCSKRVESAFVHFDERKWRAHFANGKYFGILSRDRRCTSSLFLCTESLHVQLNERTFDKNGSFKQKISPPVQNPALSLLQS